MVCALWNVQRSWICGKYWCIIYFSMSLPWVWERRGNFDVIKSLSFPYLPFNLACCFVFMNVEHDKCHLAYCMQLQMASEFPIQYDENDSLEKCHNNACVAIHALAPLLSLRLITVFKYTSDIFSSMSQLKSEAEYDRQSLFKLHLRSFRMNF